MTRGFKFRISGFWWLILPGLIAAAQRGSCDEFATLCTDRTAVERVYYSHRIGEKPPFEQASPPALIERLVKEDLRKEAVLKKVYAIEITTGMVDAEVQRINATTRAPGVLGELKAALGNDAARFARTVARPIVVERLLRNKFENDDALHAGQRKEAEQVREQLLAAKGTNAAVTNLVALLKAQQGGQISEMTWLLASYAVETNSASADEIEIKKRFGANAQIMSPAGGPGADRKAYFDELPTELQRVLRAQLRRAGDVSAVIEMPGGFLLYLATEKSDEKLGVEMLSVPKRSYEEWLAEQGDAAK